MRVTVANMSYSWPRRYNVLHLPPFQRQAVAFSETESTCNADASNLSTPLSSFARFE